MNENPEYAAMKVKIAAEALLNALKSSYYFSESLRQEIFNELDELENWLDYYECRGFKTTEV